MKNKQNHIGTVTGMEPPKEITLESVADYLAECASVVRDKEPANAMKLLNRLMTESFGDKASRVFEYLPCSIEYTVGINLVNNIQLYGNYNNGKYQTTARELLNWGWSLDEVLKVVDFTNYLTIKCVAPYFIYGQLSTHTQITSVSHSQRFGTCDRGYWMPPEFIDFMKKDTYKNMTDEEINISIQADWNIIVESYSPVELKSFMKKELNITRKEVFDRGSDMLQNRVFTLGGYINNQNAFPHFINQRTDKHTQQETREFCEMIKEILDV